MDYVSAFKQEVFRPIVTLVIPGMVAAGPWLLLLKRWIPSVDVFWNKHESAAWVIVAGALLACGLILENIGSRIEVWVLDRLLAKKNANHWNEWYEYLKLTLDEKTLGQDYIQTVLVRLKFEVAMTPALLICLLGVWRLNLEVNFWPDNWLGLYGGLLLVAAYFAMESYGSAGVLARARHTLLEKTASSQGGGMLVTWSHK